MADDDVIEQAVVSISPEIDKTFRQQVQAGVTRALKDWNPVVKVKLTADPTGFRADANRKLTAHLAGKPLTVAVRLVADATGLSAGAGKALKAYAGSHQAPEYKVKLVADASGLGASIDRAARSSTTTATAAGKRIAKAVGDGAAGSGVFDAMADDADDALKRIEGSKLRLADRTNRQLSKSLSEAFLLSGESSKVLSGAAELEAQQNKITAVAQRESARRIRIAEQESARQARAAEQASARASTAFKSISAGPKIIDWGGKGVKPMNLLLGAALALAPALFSIGANAVQASTSIAALGAVGIGAALGITGLVSAFGSLSDLLALRKTAKAQALTADPKGPANAAKAATAAMKNALDELRLKNDITDAARDQLTAEKDLSDARKQAARDLVNLRQKVADLQNQQREDTVSLAEAEDNKQKVYRSYFASALDRARANQDVNNAKNRLAGTKTDQKQARDELATGVRKGVEGSDKVTEAKDRLRRARNRVAELAAQKRQNAAAGPAAAAAAGVDGVSAAQIALNAALAKASPALRDMYNWFEKNEGTIDKLKRQLQQAFLPGFVTFLNRISERPKGGGKSTLQFLTDQSAELGRVISKYVGRLGTWTQSPFFRSAFTEIQKNNAGALDTMGTAGEKLADALLRIIKAASPLTGKFADKLLVFATWLDEVTAKADKDGSLAKWFRDAWVQMDKWLTIGKNIMIVLGNLFKGSLPTGAGLVDKIVTLTGTLATWSSSPEGVAQIGKFFGFFKGLPYAAIGKLVTELTAAFLAWRLIKFVAFTNPLATLFTAFATWAAANPEAAASAFDKINEVLSAVFTAISEHPTETAGLLAILAAAKIGKAIGFNIAIPGVTAIKDALTSRFKVLDKVFGGAASTGTMTVKAAVVNVYGAGTGADIDGKGKNKPSKPGKPLPLPGITPAAPGGLAVSALTVAGGVFAASMIVDEVLGGDGGNAVEGAKSLAFGPQAYAEWSKKNAPAFQRFFSMTLPGWISFGGTRGWSSFEDAFTNTFGDKASHFFSTTLPNAMNLGAAGSGGWAGLATNLGTWFSRTLPEGLSGGEAHTWGGLGGYAWRQAKDMIGMKLPEGVGQGLDDGKAWLWDKLKSWTGSFWGWLKGLFGVQSPSTIMAEIGTNLIVGLYNGFTTKWTELLDTVTSWISTHITGPLKGAFTSAGTAIRDGFVGGFTGLSAKLDAPVRAAKAWLNSHLIDPLNALLGSLGLPAIGKIDVSTGVAKGVGDAAGDAARKVGKAIRRADGGPVPGHSPHDRADNIPAMLTAQEFVQPVAAVKHYGTDFMEAVRTRRLPVGYAAGGLVGGLIPAAGNNLATRVATGALKNITLQGLADSISSKVGGLIGGLLGGVLGGGTPSGDRSLADTAEATARQLGASDKQLVALIAAGLVESGMRNINYGDRDSVGFLQQRTSQGWGTIPQLMNPAYATTKFIKAAQRVDKPGLTAGQLAQAVQRSAYPDRYAQRAADAAAILNRSAPFLGGYTPGTGPAGGASQAGLVAFGRWLQQRGYDVTEHPAFGGVRGGHATRSKHYVGRAIDVNKGSGTSTREQAYLREIIPEAHRRGFHSIFMSKDHYNHAHFDYNQGGLVKARKYDTGGTLPPGYTLAFNGTGRNETVRTPAQDRATAGTNRLDRRDIALLAASIARAASPSVHMDGRAVGEIVNAYTYLPAGV